MQYCSASCHASEFDPGPVEVRQCINTGEHTMYKPLNAAEVKEKKKVCSKPPDHQGQSCSKYTEIFLATD